MKSKKLGAGVGFVWMLGALFAWASGCGPTDEERIAALCDEMCDCRGGCSDSARTDCQNGGESLRDDSEDAGCRDTWEEYIVCLEGDMTCVEGQPNPGSCVTVLQDLVLCQSAAKSPCEDPSAAITGFYEECGVDPPALPSDCTEASQAELECKVSCQNEPSCEVLTGEDAAGKAAYDDCFAACEGG